MIKDYEDQKSKILGDLKDLDKKGTKKDDPLRKLYNDQLNDLNGALGESRQRQAQLGLIASPDPHIDTLNDILRQDQ